MVSADNYGRSSGACSLHARSEGGESARGEGPLARPGRAGVRGLLKPPPARPAGRSAQRSPGFGGGVSPRQRPAGRERLLINFRLKVFLLISPKSRLSFSFRFNPRLRQVTPNARSPLCWVIIFSSYFPGRFSQMNTFSSSSYHILVFRKMIFSVERINSLVSTN